MHDIKTKVMETVSNNSHVKLEEIESFFADGARALDKNSLVIKHEPPFSDWLHEYVTKALGNEFIVESQQDNLRDLGHGILAEEVNEYAASRADLVIRRDKGKATNAECCLVSVDVHSVDCVGMVAELKMDDNTNLPIWECFRNMSAIAVSLAVEFLTNGVRYSVWISSAGQMC